MYLLKVMKRKMVEQGDQSKIDVHILVTGTRRILDINNKDFDEVIKHFGQRFFDLRPKEACKASGGISYIATPVNVKSILSPKANVIETIAQQKSIGGKIPSLTRGVIVVGVILNIFWLILSQLY